MGTAKIQGELWGARAEDFAALNEPAWREVFATALDAAGVGTGTRHLDIGCGAGGALVMSRERGAEVAGFDASEALAAIARRRLPGASIDVGEMEALSFSNEAFDVVTGINSFQFAGDLVAALREARRVCKPGGAVLMLTWGPREACELMRVTMPAIIALLPPARPGAAPPSPIADPGFIEGKMEAAGLAVADARDFSSALEFSDAATAVGAIMSASARAIAHSGEDVVRAAVTATLPAVSRTDGSVIYNNRFRWVKAVRH
jgi:SAM-dependent methyltransferase